MFYIADQKIVSASSPIMAFNKTSVLILIGIIFGMVSGVFYLAYRHFKIKAFSIAMLVLMCFSLGLFLSAGAKSYLKNHHYNRFLAFVDRKNIDPKGAGWNISQSLTAIGGGGFQGQGFLKGNQKNGGFLPAQDTDFVFAVIAEEWGFVGSILIIILFITIFYRGINVIFNAKDMVGSLLATGITALFFYHVLINIGMNIGFMPVTGIPLPFISSGGSFLITCMASIGLLLNVELRKYVY
jgi:rod shape determining protein RodA